MLRSMPQKVKGMTRRQQSRCSYDRPTVRFDYHRGLLQTLAARHLHERSIAVLFGRVLLVAGVRNSSAASCS